MTRSSAHALAVAQPVIQTLMVLNILYGVAIAGLLALSFVIEGWPWARHLAVRLGLVVLFRWWRS